MIDDEVTYRTKIGDLKWREVNFYAVGRWLKRVKKILENSAKTSNIHGSECQASKTKLSTISML